eukprot:jgi/Tetstr1/466825/TSEL_001021.t1
MATTTRSSACLAMALQALLILAACWTAPAGAEPSGTSRVSRRQLQAPMGAARRRGDQGMDRNDEDLRVRIDTRISRSPMLSKIARSGGGSGRVAPPRGASIKIGAQPQPAAKSAFASMPPFPQRRSSGSGALGAMRQRQAAAAVSRPAPGLPIVDPQTGMYINQKKPSNQEAIAISRRVAKKNLPLKVDYGDGIDLPQAPKDYQEMPAKMAARRAAIAQERGGPNAPVPHPPPAPRVPKHEQKPQQPRIRGAAKAAAPPGEQVPAQPAAAAQQ